MPRSIRSVVAVLWTVVIFVLCWTPRRMMPVVEEPGGWFFIPNLDKIVHFALFTGFGLGWVAAGCRARWVVAAGFVAALVSELGQEIPIVNRDAEWLDGLADGLGVLAGVAVGVFLISQFAARFKTPSAQTP